MPKDYNQNVDLEKQDRTIRRVLAQVLIPIFILIIALGYLRDNYFRDTENEYLKIRNKEYRSIIRSLGNANQQGPTRIIFINNYAQYEIPFYIYEELSVGDSIIKNRGSNFELYIKSNGDTISRDLNSFLRSKL
ncbi:hypothetical protein EAX61_13570 [Dokdonia sinensis]|uniref:Uncharacterized protein n=1 Tax=Dokdonia sinensis TaxID=2479847 RepID=A0A3M0G688_9FLAO|nr:hypothetical protein EAX61_13570 [Dokdonia sinensis]